MINRKVFASKVYRTYSRFVDEVNANGAVAQWIERNKNTVPVFKTKSDLYRYVNSTVCGTAAIDYFEFGVYRGNSLREWVRVNTNPASRFFGFDSFEGLPEQWNDKNPAGQFSVDGELPVIEDERVQLIKGWFQNTLRGMLQTFEQKSRLVIHNDSDLHSSTMFVLTVMDPLIVPGTIVIFDEFTSPLHEFRAFHEYLAAYLRNVKLICMTDNYASQAAFVFN